MFALFIKLLTVLLPLTPLRDAMANRSFPCISIFSKHFVRNEDKNTLYFFIGM